ncbi:MAG: AhpC/TSA family protein [Bacteroidales bacterium]|jgi:peroxiredoxin|nr:AhpC/TSA family protein [Bacteroidales bacterium]
MKRIYLFAICAIALASCKQNNVKIEGTFTGSEYDKVTLSEVTTNKTTILDSAILASDKSLSYEGQITEPIFVSVKSSAGDIMNLLVNPEEEIKFNVGKDFVNNFSVEGSKDAELMVEATKNLHRTEYSIDSLQAIFAKESLAGTLSSERKKEMDKVYMSLFAKQRNMSRRFLNKNYNSLASIFVIYQKYSRDKRYILNRSSDLPFIKMVVDSLSAKYPKNRRVAVLKKDYLEMESTYNASVVVDYMNSSESSLPDLELPNVNGDSIKLSSVDGKLKMLYFWSVSNKNCVAFNTALKGVYSKYKDRGFEVYAVSLDADVAAWKKLIKFDQLNWINVNDANFPNSLQTRIWNIQQVPSYFLINSKNEIVGKNLTLKKLEIRIENQLK